MANFTQSLSDTVVCGGPQSNTLWGVPMKWGQDKWFNGGTNFPVPTDVISVKNDSYSGYFDTIILNAFSVNVPDTIILSTSTSDEHLNDGSGVWKYYLSGGVLNDEQATIPTYTLGTSPSTTYVKVTSTASVWH